MKKPSKAQIQIILAKIRKCNRSYNGKTLMNMVGKRHEIK